MTAPALPRVAHVPMALSVQASTLMAVVRQVADAYAAMGGRSLAVLSHNRDVALEGVESRYVDYTENCPRQWFTRRELAVDVVRGRLGAVRPHYGRMYDPAIRAVADAGPDVVLLYEGHYASATLPRWARVRRRSEVVLYVHNPLSRTYGRRELRRLLDAADRVVFCADHLRAETVRRLGAADDRLQVVPNGVHPRYFSRSRPAPVGEEPFVVTFVGRIAEHKGVHVMLDAAARAARTTRRPVQVRVVGSSGYGGDQGPDAYEAGIRRRAQALGLQATFTGWVEEDAVARELRTASVVCVPSLWAEGMPLTVLQAMAAGAPVVGSDSAGVAEAVGPAGLLSAAGDAEALAASLVHLAEDAEAWSRHSAAGIERAGRYTWESTALGLAGVPAPAMPAGRGSEQARP